MTPSQESQEHGLLDTSVVIDLPDLSVDQVPKMMAVSTVTVAELAAGTHVVTDARERAVRLRRLQWVEATFDPLGFDLSAASAYGHLVALLFASGRKHRRRVLDLMIGAIAVAHGFPLYTRNPDDFVGLDSVLKIVAV